MRLSTSPSSLIIINVDLPISSVNHLRRHCVMKKIMKTFRETRGFYPPALLYSRRRDKLPLAEERVLRDMKDILLNKTYVRAYLLPTQRTTFKLSTETKNYSHAYIHPRNHHVIFKNRPFVTIQHRPREPRILKRQLNTTPTHSCIIYAIYIRDVLKRSNIVRGAALSS